MGGGGFEVSEEAESLEFEGGFEKAVLNSAFVHQEVVEDPFVGEVL